MVLIDLSIHGGLSKILSQRIAFQENATVPCPSAFYYHFVASFDSKQVPKESKRCDKADTSCWAIRTC